MAVSLLTVVNRVRRNLGLNSDVTSFADTDESNDNLQDINEAYEELIIAIPPGTAFLNTSGTISAVASTRLYSLASDAQYFQLYEYSFEDETSGDVHLTFCSKEYVQGLNQRYDEVTGKPRYVYPEGNNKVGLYPIPDGSYTINYEYGTTPTSRLSATSDTFIVPDRWVRFIEKRAQEKYERRKAYQEPDVTRMEAMDLLAEIMAESWDMNSTFLMSEGF